MPSNMHRTRANAHIIHAFGHHAEVVGHALSLEPLRLGERLNAGQQQRAQLLGEDRQRDHAHDRLHSARARKANERMRNVRQEAQNSAKI